MIHDGKLRLRVSHSKTAQFLGLRADQRTRLLRKCNKRLKNFLDASSSSQCLAETEGFEPSVREFPVRRFSKPLVSATHPRLRKRLRSRGYIGQISRQQPDHSIQPGLDGPPPRQLRCEGVWRRLLRSGGRLLGTLTANGGSVCVCSGSSACLPQFWLSGLRSAGQRRRVQELPRRDLRAGQQHETPRRPGDFRARIRPRVVAAQVRQGLYRSLPQPASSRPTPSWKRSSASSRRRASRPRAGSRSPRAAGPADSSAPSITRTPPTAPNANARCG